MIKVEELRIGNLLYITDKQREELFDSEIKTSNNYVSVVNISIDNCLEVYIDSNVLEYDLNELKPIPLTEEILLKCGGKEVESNWYDYGKFEYDLETSELWIFGSYEAITHIKHLHQLQNLYFALTGEELEVEL